MWLNYCLVTLLAALAGARLFYALENWGYFSGHPLQILYLWQGGLAWPGAAAGAVSAAIWQSYTYRPTPGMALAHLPLGLFGDRLFPLLATISITTWLGCMQTGAAYGAVLPEGTWWGIRAADEAGSVALRVPLQPLAALSLLLFFWILETRFKTAQPTGRLSVLAATGLLLHLLVFSFFIASPAPSWNGLRIDTWAAIFFLALTGVSCLASYLFRRRSIPALPLLCFPLCG